MHRVPSAHGLALGTEGGSHVEGTSCLDLCWSQDTIVGGHREDRGAGPGDHVDKGSLE